MTLVSRFVVIDTNVALDLFVFEDPAAAALRGALDDGSAQWLATAAMRDELARVLGYPRVVRWLRCRGRDPQRVAAQVLARFDRDARRVDAAPAAPLACRDSEDQCFIDLALAHGARLASRDRAVTEVWRRLVAPAAGAPGCRGVVNPRPGPGRRRGS